MTASAQTRVRIREIGPDQMDLYESIPIAYEVRSILRVQSIDENDPWIGGMCLVEEAVPEPYLKDYDTQEEGLYAPTRWAEEFNIHGWGLFLAETPERTQIMPVGAAAVAVNTPEVHMLERRQDLAVLWDIRVAPGWRGRGVGRALFWHAVQWAKGRGYRQMKIETQNVNVPACRFYARMGCELGSIHRFGYAGIPDVSQEAMLLWYLDLEKARTD